MIEDRGGFFIRRLNQIWAARIARRFRATGYDVTSVQFAALEAIVEGDGLDQATLALRIGCDRATTGGLVGRLEQAGYLSRTVNPADRRARLLTPTAAGRAACAALRIEAAALEETFFAPLATAERQQFMAILRRLVEVGNATGIAPDYRAPRAGSDTDAPT